MFEDSEKHLIETVSAYAAGAESQPSWQIDLWVLTINYSAQAIVTFRWCYHAEYISLGPGALN